ncbi:zinc finger protein [Wuchereria bancrofti]|uniref:Zinc finger protein n=1 Tax=Wuchereria bancrofti TaxID=6293 RepID=J9EU29_WUCBA|nr:zinc finger protein [Wuchereria bancrofti]
MSSDQQKKGSSLEKKSSAPNYCHGVASQSARYGYRRFQNAPKKQLKLQKSLAVTKNDEIQSVEHSCTTVPISNANVEEKGLTKRRNNGAVPTLSLKVSKRKVCKYFATENSCYFGEYCRFLHIRDENNDNNFDSVPSHINLKSTRTIVRPNVTAISRDDIGKEEQLDIRNSEINYFGRRFHDAKFAYDGSSYFIEFDYKITDPDWIFDVKTIGLRLKIPEHYPCEMIMVTLNQSTLPVPLVSHFNKEVKKFLEEKFMEAKKCDTYVGIGKMFIRWLDRNILKFLSKTDKTKVEVCDSAEVMQSRNYGEAKVESSSKIEIAMEEVINSKQSSKGKAIQARIFWNDLNGNIATLSIITMAVSIKCAKCGALSFLICSVKQLSISHCKKCLNGSSIHISPQLVHQNSNVIALLEPKGCIPVDCVLLSSKLSYTCLQCSKEATVENLTYGVSNKSWCYGCHSKCEFEIKTIRFVGDFNAIEKEDSSVPKSKKKVERSVMLVEGQPLPENGACKHYKKSYRWFRFPCCGKLYPCDLCHNDAEKEHEMKLANRMVCGFCSKEQPFQKAKPCINCNENVTRVKSHFWEGGKGCRDQVVMCRNDRRKYANSLMKTVSNKHAAQLKFKGDNKKK